MCRGAWTKSVGSDGAGYRRRDMGRLGHSSPDLAPRILHDRGRLAILWLGIRRRQSGCFPLFLLDRVLFEPFRPRNPASSMSSESAISSARSLARAVRERVWTARAGETEDELCSAEREATNCWSISAGRRKQNWIPPRVVRYEDTYYRLEKSFSNKGPRPFGYRLRRLSAGVPGRSVLTIRRPAPEFETKMIGGARSFRFLTPWSPLTLSACNQ